MKEMFCQHDEMFRDFIHTDFNNDPVEFDHQLLIDTILTFRPSKKFECSQEFPEFVVVFDFGEDPLDALDEKFFPLIEDFCNSVGRDCADLIKISTCAPWTLFKQRTQLPSLMDYGHSGKWYFGYERDDLDPWEMFLTERFGFGTRLA